MFHSSVLHPTYRTLGLWLVAFVLVVQLFAPTLATRHLVSQAVFSANLQTISICTAHGLQQITVDANGQKVDTDAQAAACAKCAFCTALAAMPLIPALYSVKAPMASSLAVNPLFAFMLPLLNKLWPPSNAPPALCPMH